MATFNLCNQFDHKTDSTTSKVFYKGKLFQEYEDVEQPKPEEKKKFDGSSLTGKVIGTAAAIGCVAAAVGLGVAWLGVTVLSGGAAGATALVIGCIAGL